MRRWSRIAHAHKHPLESESDAARDKAAETTKREDFESDALVVGEHLRVHDERLRPEDGQALGRDGRVIGRRTSGAKEFIPLWRLERLSVRTGRHRRGRVGGEGRRRPRVRVVEGGR